MFNVISIILLCRVKKFLKTAKKKIKEYESLESSSLTTIHGEMKNRFTDAEMEVSNLRTKVYFPLTIKTFSKVIIFHK